MLTRPSLTLVWVNNLEEPTVTDQTTMRQCQRLQVINMHIHNRQQQAACIFITHNRLRTLRPALSGRLKGCDLL